jgi:hypothetical protein
MNCGEESRKEVIRKENSMWHHEELRNGTDLCKTNVGEGEKKEVMLWAPKRERKISI